MATRPDPARAHRMRPLDPGLVAFVEALARANAARDVHARATGPGRIEDAPACEP